MLFAGSFHFLKPPHMAEPQGDDAQSLGPEILCLLKITQGRRAGTFSQSRYVLFVHQPKRRDGEKSGGCAACVSNPSPPHPLLSVNSNSYQDTLGEKLSP